MWRFRCAVLIFSIFFNFGSYATAQTTQIKSSEDVKRYPRDAQRDYADARARCVFEKYDIVLKSGDACAGIDMNVCEVDSVLPEGEGYYRIVQIGPFTTTGGNQEWMCDIWGDSTPYVGTYVTRALLALTEPNTGELISFPPLHLHHGNIANPSQSTHNAYLPPIDRDLLGEIPWMLDNFFGSSSSSECLRELGGPDCFNLVMPPGLALKQYSSGMELLKVMVEDVRAMNSPPMSTVVEFSNFRVTKPDRTKPPLKPAVLAMFAVGSHGPANTYPLKYNTPMYNVGTFYIPVKMHMSHTQVHTHALDGDELWAVLGTQDDLGIPKDAQSPLYWKKDSTDGPNHGIVVSDAKDLPPGESMESWKIKLEESLHLAGDEWAKRPGETTKEEERGTSEHSHSRAGAGVGSSKKRDYFKSFNEASPQPGVSKPQLLCKWYGEMEHLTHDDIEEQKQEFQALFKNGGHHRHRRRRLLQSGGVEADSISNTTSSFPSSAVAAAADRDLSGGGHTRHKETYHGGSNTVSDESSSFQPSSGKSDPREDRITRRASTSDGIGLDGYVIEQTNTEAWSRDMVPPKKQYDNLYSGVLPSRYYRQPVSSLERREPRYTQCEGFTIEAGDFLTIIQFNEPRVNPTLQEDDVSLQFIKHQHTKLFGIATVPDAPWFY